MLMPTAKPLDELENHSEFIARHIGISAADEQHMLEVIGAASRRALIEAIVPQSIADHYAVHSLPHLTLAILAGRTEFPLVQTSELDRHEI